MATLSNIILDDELTDMEVELLTQGHKIQTDFSRELYRQLGEYEYNEDGFTMKEVTNVENLDIQIEVIRAENFNTVIW